MAVTVDAVPTFKPGVPHAVLPLPDRAGFDASPDGQMFLLAKPVDTPADDVAPQLDIVLNWSQELRRLVRAD
jgi:hypothetical protein